MLLWVLTKQPCRLSQAGSAERGATMESLLALITERLNLALTHHCSICASWCICQPRIVWFNVISEIFHTGQ